MLITIRQKFRPSIQGRNEFQVVQGKKVGTTKAPAGSFLLNIPENAKTKKLSINVDRVIPNPFKGLESLPSNWSSSNIPQRDKITVQEYLEIKYNRPPGYYSNHIFDPLNTTDLKKEPRTALQSFKLILNDGATVIDTETEEGAVAYEMILSNPYLIAPSYEAAESSATARFYVFHQEEAEEKKATNARISLKAAAKLNDLIENYPIEKAYQVAIVLKIGKGKIAQAAILNLLNTWISSDDKINQKGKSQRIEEFLEVVNLATSKAALEKQRFNTLFLLQELINHRVVSDIQEKYRWLSKSNTNLEVLGKTKEKAIEFLMADENKEYVEDLKKELNANRAVAL